MLKDRFFLIFVPDNDPEKWQQLCVYESGDPYPQIVFSTLEEIEKQKKWQEENKVYPQDIPGKLVIVEFHEFTGRQLD